MFLVYIQGKLLLRFNRLGSNHIVRLSGGSKQKKAFFNQAPIATLDNSATRIVAGYVLDGAGIEMESIEISCQVGDDCHYNFPIDIEEGGVSAFPSPAVAPSPQPLADGIAVKKPG